jgi:hypothetical protein
LEYKWTEELTEEERKFLLYLPFSITIEKYNTIIVHAGMIPSFSVGMYIRERKWGEGRKVVVVRFRCV